MLIISYMYHFVCAIDIVDDFKMKVIPQGVICLADSTLYKCLSEQSYFEDLVWLSNELYA